MISSKSSYINTKTSKISRQSSIIRLFSSVFIALLIGIYTLVNISSSTVMNNKVASADDGFDPVREVMCLWGRESMPGMIYQVSQTSDLQFQLRSKSAITLGYQNVDSSFLNQILEFSGHDFKRINEDIIGYELQKDNSTGEEGPETPPTDTEEGEANYNKGVQVNPYDRFGVAGLTWSAYAGEWKHVVIDACSPGSAKDPETGLYYENRLVPQSTWTDIGTSKDVRTLQFRDTGVFSAIDGASLNNIANLIFYIAKMIIVITIALINFAFSDITTLLGINEMLLGKEGAEGGMFNQLFSGVFMGLITLVFIVTAIQIFWKGIVKREVRQSFSILIRSVLLFMVAVAISVNPTPWLKAPNTFSIGVQAVLVEAMNTGIAGGNGLCATSNGIKEAKEETRDSQQTVETDTDFLSRISANMSSAIGCSLWQQFLLEPWAQGQFGTDWNKTWAEGQVADWATNMPEEFKSSSSNAKMVGKAEVPLGGGEVINNWAVYQISTQTNVHVPTGNEGKPSKYTQHIANDWWRIADLLSNYTEVENTITVSGYSSDVSSTEEKYPIIDLEQKPLENWEAWTGSNGWSRILTALSAVFVAFVGVLAPLFFAALSAVYSVGLSILMMFAPIMLLLGCWADKGWEIFKGWLQLVAQTLLKRIVTGLLLIFSLIFSAIAIEFMQTDGWWSGVFLIVTLSTILIASRKKLLDSVNSVRFASVDFGQNVKEVMNKSKYVTSTAQVAASGAVGGISAKNAGGSFNAGMGAAVRQELKTLSYQSPKLTKVRQTYEQTKESENRQVSNTLCSVCSKRLDSYATAFQDDSGNYYCEECGENYDNGEFRSIDITTRKERETFEEKKYPIRSVIPSHEKRISRIKDDETSSVDSRKELGEISNSTIDEINNVVKNRKGIGVDEFPPPPQEIRKYLNLNEIKKAWKLADDGGYEYIRYAYTAAWAKWYIDTLGEKFEGTLQELVKEMLIFQDDSNQNRANNE